MELLIANGVAWNRNENQTSCGVFCAVNPKKLDSLVLEDENLNKKREKNI